MSKLEIWYLSISESGSWRAGGSSAVSRNEGDVPQVTLHSHSGPSYLSTTVTARVAERQVLSMVLLMIFSQRHFRKISFIFLVVI